MRDFRLSIQLAAAVLAIGVTPSLAQTSGPIQLAPPPQDAGTAAPSAETGGATVTVTEPAATGKTGVQVDQLQSVDADSIGLLDEAAGGLGIKMWRGTDRSLVDSLLPALPVYSRSHTIRRLMRRLLLSTATVPEGAATGPQSLIALRVGLLMAMGHTAAAQELQAAVPSQYKDEVLTQLAVGAQLTDQDIDGACAEVRAQLRESDALFWQKAMAFCHAMAGEHDQAALATDLLRELGAADDEVFFALVEALAGADIPAIEKLPNPTPMVLAMMRANERSLPPDVLDGVEAAMLRSVAEDETLDQDVRLRAAERAMSVGTLAPGSLARIYQSVEFSQDEIDAAFTAADADQAGTPTTRALLYQAAAAQVVPAARAEVLARAWDVARKGGAYHVMTQVTLSQLDDIKPDLPLAWFAPEAVRALLLAGEVDLARSWYGTVSRSARRDPQAAHATAEMWPLMRLAAPDQAEKWADARILDWLSARIDDEAVGEAAAEYTAGVLFGLFQVLGEPVGGAGWRNIVGQLYHTAGVTVNPALWFGMRNAAAAGRRGETVLYALVALRGGALKNIDPLIVAAAVESLKAVGLKAEARALAVEAAVARGA